MGKAAQKAVAKVGQQVHRELGKLNDCCQFCNNRLVLEAVRRGDTGEVKRLIADYENITNPYQAFSFTNTDENALRAIAQSKNLDLIKLVIKDFQHKKPRKRLESTILQQFDRGETSRYNFHHPIKEIN